jgi:hypothetical protein
MKILSFSIGIIFAYFIIKIFVNFKKHGYNSTDIKNIILNDGKNKYRLIPITYTCIYDIKHESTD